VDDILPYRRYLGGAQFSSRRKERKRDEREREEGKKGGEKSSPLDSARYLPRRFH
jgi:hypothetical protein